MKLIVGLGNPGAQYSQTRHNAGFIAVDHIAEYFNFDEFKESGKHKAEIAEGQIAGEKVLLVKAQTFMNLSGRSVASLMNFYKTSTDDLIVIHDDVDIPFGTLRIRPDGSAGGHNGIKSIIADIGTQEFIRIRLGIKPEKSFPGALEDYVLGKMTENESIGLNEIIDRTPKIIELLITADIEEVMHSYN